MKILIKDLLITVENFKHTEKYPKVSYFCLNSNYFFMTYNLLKGKKGIIFGALNDKSIAWKVAERAFDEGAAFTLTNTPIAIRFGDIDKLATNCQSLVIPADATSEKDIEQLIAESMKFLGGKLDFILHSIGMSFNVRKGKQYDDLDYEYFHKTIDISAMSFHKLLQIAKKMDAINEWGSVVALSYIAAQRTLFRYNDMADAKAMLESIARSFGYLYGREKHIRINTISQSPTRTTAGSGVHGIDDLIDFTDRMSPLGNATAEECADYCVTLFSDLTRKVTMQNLFHDGGFSSMGMSERAIMQYSKSFDDKETEK
jgi:enoyl-[acyl-carrier protein] reductase I